MAEERPKNFIERLPEIIDREEKDVSHLDVEMLDILYPDKGRDESTAIFTREISNFCSVSFFQ